MIVNISDKMKVIIDLKTDAKWRDGRRNGLSCYAVGYAFLRGEFMDNKNLIELFLKDAKPDFNLFIGLVKKLNGSFAIILKDEDGIFASVDKIRSIPIFYGIKKDTFLISDNAHSIKKRLGEDAVDSHAVEEFLMSGYVSQNETLYRGIRQLQAGEALYFQLKNKNRGSIEDVLTNRYYRYYNKEKKNLSIEKLIDSYDDILFRTFQRLVESVRGKEIVVPLSGGVDSRLIASMLKRLDYRDVVCLSYGVPNNWETKISRKVAERLGYDWIYVPYSRRIWHEVYRSQEWRDFFYSQDNLSSLPNVNDWIALSELKHKKSIADDAIFVPGHTGDFISGGHLQYIFGKRERGLTKQDLIYAILRKHYSLWPAKLDDSGIKDYLIDRLSAFFDCLPLRSEEDIADAYECWEWQERQAKFIVNSVRNYDFWHFEWRLPLWDSEIMDFWSTLPYGLKLGKKLYLSYLKEKDGFRLFTEDLRRKKLHKRRLLDGRLRKFIEYFRGTSGLYGIYNYFVVTFLNMGRRNTISILAKDYIKKFRERV